MSFDAHANFSYSTVATAPSPATSGTSLVVQTGDGAKFPAAPFNATVWPAGVQPTSDVAEIVRVTAKSTDTFTITRSQESSSARSIGVGDQIAATITAKTLTDIENAIAPTRQIFTASGTYTLPSGCKAILVECIGAGGAGGGTPATTGSGNGQNAAAGGGGGGAYAASLIASPSSSYTVTVGTGGTGSAGAGGGNGSNTSFGTAVIAEAGQGAPVAVKDVGTFPDSSGSPARGGLASNSTGDLKIEGGSGFGGIMLRLGFPWAGGGGDAARGGGQRLSGPSEVTAAGNAGRQYGGGGQGACALLSAAAQAGGAGAAGICIVTEYY